ncbi:M28 family metallopeptidase [Mesonia ostreae]|uniref:M28 family metallopeptidase n=1 Tax=Mesonia ostreae TaxID=861110 RepID=A0ABU2KKB9_9FLAO|nr:M28 family metallopeptidase [Mesonia ostreae]MDT0295170.1 M28 family metallopeptidase [Mesonia ostreae]
MHKILLVAALGTMFSCSVQKDQSLSEANVETYGNTITSAELKEHLYTFASDEYQGRDTGEPGQKMAAEYLKKEYQKLNIASPLGDSYYQHIPSSFFNDKFKASENVVAFIEGSEFPEEIVVISAHYDHVGMSDGEIYNGADDDGSGTVSMLEMAEAFKKAAEDGFSPRRSILFLHVTGEEKGLLGSKYYTENPIFPLENTVTNLNTDMIGRIDPAHEGKADYVYLIGSDKLSTDLHKVSEEMNSKYVNLDLDYTYNDENDPNRFYYRSDHYNFAKHNIPVIFYFNGTHADYHKPTDTADKIEYDLLEKRTKLIFYTAWEVANRDERLVVDKAE